MRTILLFTIPVLLLGLISCSGSKSEINRLITENIELKGQLDSIMSEIDDYEFQAVVVPFKDSIRVGEEYRADVMMNVGKKSTPINVFSGNGFEGNDLIDPIRLENYSNSASILKGSGDKPGNYKIYGKVEVDFFGKTQTRFFHIEYSVID